MGDPPEVLLRTLPPGVPLQLRLPPKVGLSEEWSCVKQGPASPTGFSKRAPGKVLPARETTPGAPLRAPDRLVDKRYVKRPGAHNGTGTPKIRWSDAQLTVMLKRALSAEDGYWARRVINGLILKAAKGNPGAQKILWERCEGLLQQKIEMSGEVNLSKQVLLTDIRRKPEMPVLDVQAEVKRDPGPA